MYITAYGGTVLIAVLPVELENVCAESTAVMLCDLPESLSVVPVRVCGVGCVVVCTIGSSNGYPVPVVDEITWSASWL